MGNGQPSVGTDHRFHFPQEDLAALCVDKKLRTAEIHRTNDFYGQASVLKRYTGLPQRHPLKVVLEHGVKLTDTIWDNDLEARLPYVFTCSSWRAKINQRLHGRRSIAVGSCFLYAMRLVRAAGIPGPAAGGHHGTLVFPAHSTRKVKARFDHAEFARRLDALPDRLKPIVICIYWLDYLAGAHRDYQDRGFRVVTAGHINDPDFLLRLYDLCRQFKYAVSNDVGSHLFAAVASGCSFFYVPGPDIRYDDEEGARGEFAGENPQYVRIRRESLELFDRPLLTPTDQQKAFVDRYLGADCVRTPAQLRRLFLASEWADRYRPLRAVNAHASRAVLPAKWMRVLWPQALVRLDRSIRKRFAQRSRSQAR